MKSLPAFILCAAAATLALTDPVCRAADPSPGQVNACVEIYELPQAKAVAWQKMFDEASDADHRKLVLDLRAAKSSDDARTVGFGQRLCRLNDKSTVETVELYRYPTEFSNKDGFASPTSFEVNKVGCTMTLEISPAGPENVYAVNVNIRDVALLSTARYAASKADRPGSIEQPVFSTQTITTQFQLAAGVPKLVGVYAPFKGDQDTGLRRMVFVTVSPER